MTDNFTFDTTIPATNDNPSDDQPDMQINNASIASIIAINHVGFNLENGGQHTAIQFNIDNDYTPTGTVSPPQLFITFGVPVPQLRYYSGTPGESSDQYVTTIGPPTSGSTFLFNGIILKWGTTVVVASGSIITFASDFPNNCFTVIANSGTTSSTTEMITSTFTNSGFTVTFSGGGRAVNYVAIGN